MITYTARPYGWIGNNADWKDNNPTWTYVDMCWPEASVMFEIQCPQLVTLRTVLRLVYTPDGSMTVPAVLPCYGTLHDIGDVFTWFDSVWWDPRVGVWVRCSRDLHAASIHRIGNASPSYPNGRGPRRQIKVWMPKHTTCEWSPLDRFEIDRCAQDIVQIVARMSGAPLETVYAVSFKHIENAAVAKAFMERGLKLLLLVDPAIQEMYNQHLEHAMEPLVRRHDDEFMLTQSDEARLALDVWRAREHLELLEPLPEDL